ncbi:TPA: hypothetical protein ACPY56_004188 [Yersinia enterocolitica]
MNKLTEQEYTRKPDGGLAEQIEVLEAFAEGDADNTELLMLLIELRSLRAELAAIKALPPIAWNAGNQYGEIVGLFDTENAAKLMASNWMYGKVIPLIAKPAEDKCS